MITELTPALIDCDWLAGRLDSPGLVVLDATFFLPNQGRDAADEYRAEHIPGASFFDVDVIADRSSPLPHMLPSPDEFAEAAGALGIDNATQVVVYDNNSFMASARGWWTFRVFGHDRVSVLDGGLMRWKALGHAVDSGAPRPKSSHRFEAGFRPELVCELSAMRGRVAQGGSQIVDARSPGRYAGSEPEPRAGLRSGHIPDSRNVFFKQLIDADTGLLKPERALAGVFQAARLDLRQPIVTTCGTGVTAAILALGLFRLGRTDVPVYDGSWAEWGGQTDTPVQTGA